LTFIENPGAMTLHSPTKQPSTQATQSSTLVSRRTICFFIIGSTECRRFTLLGKSIKYRVCRSYHVGFMIPINTKILVSSFACLLRQPFGKGKPIRSAKKKGCYKPRLHLFFYSLLTLQLNMFDLLF
jgi:hypothetical protein